MRFGNLPVHPVRHMLRARPDGPRRCGARPWSGISWSGHGGAIMTPSPCWQAPRSVDWMPRHASSSAMQTWHRTPCRRPWSAAGATCPPFATPTASTPGSIARLPRRAATSQAPTHRGHAPSDPSPCGARQPVGLGRPGPRRARRPSPRTGAPHRHRPALLPGPAADRRRGCHGRAAGDRQVAAPPGHPGAAGDARRGRSRPPAPAGGRPA